MPQPASATDSPFLSRGRRRAPRHLSHYAPPASRRNREAYRSRKPATGFVDPTSRRCRFGAHGGRDLIDPRDQIDPTDQTDPTDLIDLTDPIGPDRS
jgi:hypothetical protein